jgi:hypothetical protein
MAGFTPLPWWTDHSRLAAAEIIALMAKSDWAAPLLSGLASAIVTQQDEAWAAALIAHGPVDKVHLDFAAISAVAGVAATERWLTGMADAGEFTAALGHAVQLGQWSDPFAGKMLAGVLRVAAKEPDYTFYIYLPTVALRLPVPRLNAAAEGWEPFFDKPYLRNALDSFLQNVQLRKVIHEELSSISP